MTRHIICQRCGSVNNYRIKHAAQWAKAICNNCDYYINYLYPEKIKTPPVVHPVNAVMSTLINGSICLTDLLAQAQKAHSAFSRGKNDKVYFNFTQWINDEADQYGNHSSLQLNSTKEKKEAEGKIYIGNGKKSEGTQATPLTAQQAAPMATALDNLPF